MRRLTVLLIAAAMLVSLVLSACAKPAPAPSPTPSPPPSAKPTLAASPTAAPPLPSPAPSQASPAVADFFKQNQVNVVVGFAAGGGTDYAARLVANFWTNVTGGSAIVKNMPGGGGIVASNFIYKAKPDGITIGLAPFGSCLMGPALFKSEGMDFDVTKFNYIGTYGDEPYTLAIGKDLPYNTPIDLQKAKGLKLGADAKFGGPPLGCVLAIHILGLPEAVVIYGSWKSTPEIALSAAKGEISGYCYNSSAVAADVEKGFVKPIVNIGYLKSQAFPNTPALSEVVKLTPENEKLMKIYNGAFKAGKVVIAPPGMPDDKMQYLRDAFDRMMKLEEFQKEVKARYKAFEPPVSGKDTAALIKDMAATSADDVAKLQQLADKYMK